MVSVYITCVSPFVLPLCFPLLFFKNISRRTFSAYFVCPWVQSPLPPSFFGSGREKFVCKQYCESEVKISVLWKHHSKANYKSARSSIETFCVPYLENQTISA